MWMVVGLGCGMEVGMCVCVGMGRVYECRGGMWRRE